MVTVPGIRFVAGGTLVDRALELLGAGPTDSATVVRDVMGLSRFQQGVAERLAVALLGADPRVQRLGDGRWVLVSEAYASPRLRDCTFAVVDVETTGSRPGKGDRVVEIAVATVSGDRVTLVLDALVNPKRPIPYRVTSLTRITAAMLRDKPPFDGIAQQVVTSLAGRVFVAHNLRFDWRFVTMEVQRAQDVLLDGPRLCTVSLARRLLTGLRSRSLDSLACYFGIEIKGRHRAGGDAMATARVLQRLLEIAEERGAVRLIDLHRLGRPRRRKKKSALPTSMQDL
jgi:DNA polymerase-3 subunit epsilon